MPGFPTTDDGFADPAADAHAEPPAVVVTTVKPRDGPALIFIACVAVVVVGGFAIALIGSNQSKAGGASLGQLRGVAFGARSASPIIRRVAVDGDPPPDVTHSLVVPTGTSVISAKQPPPSVDLYNATIRLGVAHSAAQVATFFQRELAHDHWSILAIDSDATGDGTKIFARFGSADGFYWEVGVEVNPVAASITPALGGGAEATSTVSISLFEIDDQD